jgi:hypothetical protein
VARARGIAGRARLGVAWKIAAATLATLVLASCGGGGGGGSSDSSNTLQLSTLSNRADLVSDGDALVQLSVPTGALASSLKVTLNGTDVTGSFATRADGRMTALLSGLANGDNVVEASSLGAFGGRLTITNAPRQGPVLSGAQITPFYCATPTAQATSGTTPATNASGLSAQPDASCNIATETKLYYRTTTAGCSTSSVPDPSPSVSGTATTIPATPTVANGCFKPYVAGSARPADMATTTTDAGVTVDYIVRVERGTMNRGIYDIVALFDPTKPWTATAPQAAWNGKLYFSFGASTGQPRRQIRPATAWPTLELQIGKGYVVAMNSMTDSSRNSNRVLMSETTMMMKEHVIDSYGPLKFTMGSGCSGGSINSNMNTSISPGLLDGVVTSCTYPDSETTSMEVGDCTMLVEAYQKSELIGATGIWAGLTQAQINAKKAAINGHVDQTACQGWYNAFGSNGKAGLFFPRTVTNAISGAITQSAGATNNCELPNSAVYDPANATATATLPRCNAWSWGESIWGKAGSGPAARDTRDNTGVQYGLKALMAGTITVEDFITLNQVIGGTDRDSTPRAARTTADAEALAIAYRSGIVGSGKQWSKTAMLDLRGWDDSQINLPPGVAASLAIHHQWFSFAIRDRLVRDAGDANNQALWRFAQPNLLGSTALNVSAFTAMDEWLTKLKADTSSATIEQKVRTARPTSGANDTRDFCLLTQSSGVATTTRTFDQAACDADAFLKPSLSPRQVAGGPRSEDVLKCQLKPLNQADYTGVTFTTAQWARVQAAFPDGVCDWTKAGVGQTVAVSPLTFKAGPGGVALPAAPVSAAP